MRSLLFIATFIFGLCSSFAHETYHRPGICTSASIPGRNVDEAIRNCTYRGGTVANCSNNVNIYCPGRYYCTAASYAGSTWESAVEHCQAAGGAYEVCYNSIVCSVFQPRQ
jgi:hypothetical protein